MSSIIRSARISATARVLRKQGEEAQLSHSVSKEAHATSVMAAATAKKEKEEKDKEVAQRLTLMVEEQLAAEREKMARELSALREKAKEEGYAEGLAKAESETRHAEQTLQKNINHRAALLTRIREDLCENAQDDMVQIVYAACCKIIGKHAIEPRIVAQMVKDILREQNEASSIEVHLNSEDLEAIRPYLSMSELENIQWRSSASVALGGCLVESSEGSLDARLETQLTSLKNVLIATRARQAGKTKDD